jgi:hypothetical protein
MKNNLFSTFNLLKKTKDFFKFTFLLTIFFLVVTPIAFFLRLIKRDILNLKLHNLKSYWIKRNSKTNTMKKQY